MPNTQDRGHNPLDDEDLNLRLVGYGGTKEYGGSTIRKDWVPTVDARNRTRVQQTGCKGDRGFQFSELILGTAKLAERIGNHLKKDGTLDPLGQYLKMGIFGRSVRTGWCQLGTDSDRQLAKMPEKALGLW